MKQSICLIICILFFNITSNANEKPIIINVNSHMTGPSAQVSSENKVDLYQRNSLYPFESLYDNCKKKVPGIYSNLLKHKYVIVAGFLCTSYATIQYKIHCVNKIINNPASWNNWKPEMSTQQLASVPHCSLTPELINTIQKKHFLRSKTTRTQSMMPPFDQFIKDVLQELETLEWYITAQKLTKGMHLSNLFCFKHKKSFIQEKINRIHTLLDIFTTWHTKELLKES